MTATAAPLDDVQQLARLASAVADLRTQVARRIVGQTSVLMRLMHRSTQVTLKRSSN